MKVILDTNVLISLALGGGPTMQRIRTAWFSGEVDLLVSEELLKEFAEVANRPRLITRFQTPTTIQGFVRDLRLGGELLPLPKPYPDAPDEGDRFLLALARAANAEVLVTGDKALLELGRFENTIIVSPRDFVDRLR